MIACLDTSALLRLLVRQPGSDAAERVWEAARVAVASELVAPQARAALAAARSDGRLDAAGARHARTLLDWLTSQLRLVGVDGALARHAGELAERHGLDDRAALHLATALAVADPRAVVTTWDAALATAALAEGRPVATTRT